MEIKRVCKTVAVSAAVLFGLQLLLVLLKHLIFCFVERTNFSDRAASLAGMLLLSAMVLLFARRRGWDCALFPHRFGRGYLAASVLFVMLLVGAPLLSRQCTGEEWLLLLYGSVVVPLYEELVFRGVLWERLATVIDNPLVVSLINALLFALWHLGYWDALAFRAGTGALGVLLIWKSVTGLAFGVILGLLRLKTKNCFSTMLLHGVLNLFAR